MTNLGELADQVRAKNAGPFWITLDVFFRNAADYEFVTGSGIVSPQAIGRLYRVNPASVKYFELPALHVVKISFPRPVTAGSFQDRDLHGGQQHVPLAALPLPGMTHLPSFAFATSPPEMERGASYEFVLNHVLDLDGGTDLFRVELSEVSHD